MERAKQKPRFAVLLSLLIAKTSISQRELARRSGVNFVTISRVCSGQYLHTLTAATVEALAGQLDCSADQRVELFQAAGLVLPELLELFKRDTPRRVLGMVHYWQILLSRSE